MKIPHQYLNKYDKSKDNVFYIRDKLLFVEIESKYSALSISLKMKNRFLAL